MAELDNLTVANRAPALEPSAPKKAEADRAEIKRLAQEFEAMLMTQILRDMRRTMVDDEEDQESGFGAGALLDTSQVELGRALSRAGGLGLTDSLLKVFQRQILAVNDEDAAPVSPAALAGPDPLVALPEGVPAAPVSVGPPTSRGPQSISDVLARVTDVAPVSSRFGWRQDPMSGASKFHQGIDVAVAYGADVKAAAAGTVVFSGVQSGYGHTIVIDHDNGRQTRYAHLSEELVKVGDAVEEGQVVAKSGNSGRSTGAHLHFEVLVNGQPVNPAAAGL